MKNKMMTSIFGLMGAVLPFGISFASAPALPIPTEEISYAVMQEVLNKPEFGQMNKEVFLSHFDFDSQTGMPVSLIPNACLASVAEIENVNEQQGICERFFEKLFETQNNYANRINVSVDELAQSNNLTPDTTKLAQTSDNKYYVANVAMPVDLSHLSPVDQANLKSQPAVFTKRNKFVCAFGEVNGQKICKQDSNSTEYFEYSGGMLSLKDKSSFGGDFYRSVPFGYSALEPLTMEILSAKRQSWSEVGQSYVAMVDASQTQGLSPDALSERQAGRESCMEQFLIEIEQKTGMKPTSDKISVSDDCDLEKCWVDVSYLALKDSCEYPLWGGVGYTEQVGHPSQIAKVEAEAEAQRQAEQRQREEEQRRQRQAEQRRQREAEAQRQREEDAIQDARIEIIAERERILNLDMPPSNDASGLLRGGFDFIEVKGAGSFTCGNESSRANSENLRRGDFVTINVAKDVALYESSRSILEAGGHPWIRDDRLIDRVPYVEFVRCKCTSDDILGNHLNWRFECERLNGPFLNGVGVPASEVKGAQYCLGDICYERLASFAPSYSINQHGIDFIARCPNGTQYEAEFNACLPPLLMTDKNHELEEVSVTEKRK